MHQTNLYIPLATGQTIPHDVYVSLASQTVDINIMPCCTNGVIRSNHDLKPDNTKKVAGELNSRNLALSLLKADGKEFALMQDRDIVHLRHDNYQRAIQYLKDHSKIGIIALPWLDKSDAPHIRMQAMILRVAALDNFTFRRTGGACVCYDVVADMNAAGWDYCYLPSDVKLITELRGE